MERIFFVLFLLSISALTMGGTTLWQVAQTAKSAVAEVQQRAAEQFPKLKSWSSTGCVAVATGMMSFEQWLSTPPAKNFLRLKEACGPRNPPSERCQIETCNQV